MTEARSRPDQCGALDRLADSFESCRLPREAWTHQAHLLVGFWHATHLTAGEALARLRDGIRRLNASHGGVNSDTAGYHETITAAYLHLLVHFAERHRHVPADRAARCLLEGPIASRDVLARFWSPDRLLSPLARAEWVPPDRAPLDASALLQACRCAEAPPDSAAQATATRGPRS